LRLDELSVSPLRSDLALFDLLYGARGRGDVDGHAFEVESAQVPGGRLTTWRAPEVPLSLAMPYLGRGSRWIEAGVVEVEVEDRWLTEHGLAIGSCSGSVTVPRPSPICDGCWTICAAAPPGGRSGALCTTVASLVARTCSVPARQS
jgi:hypothetical protein